MVYRLYMMDKLRTTIEVSFMYILLEEHNETQKDV